MSIKALNLSEVAKLNESEQKQSYSAFLRGRHTLNGELTELDKRIADFERVYESSTETMIKRLQSGQQAETAEIGRWLMLVELRNRVKQAT